MAIVQNPHIGRSSGQFATGIFYTVLGKNVLRSKPIEVEQPNTDAQLVMRARMRLISKISKWVGAATRVGYARQAVGMYTRNYFIKENYDFLVGTNPEAITFNFEELTVAKGSLCVLHNVVAEKDGTNLIVTWEVFADVVSETWKVCIVLTTGEQLETRVYLEAADADALTKTFATTPYNVDDTVVIFAYDPTSLEASDSVNVSIVAA